MSLNVGPEVIGWGDPRLSSVNPESFETYYAQGNIPRGLPWAISNLAPNQIEVAMGYGSSFSNAAVAGSRLDVMTVVRDPLEFYREVKGKGLHLGTIPSPRFHAWWNEQKINFYLGDFNLNGEEYGVKVGVIGHDEFLKHARGSRPDAIESGDGKGHMWIAGRLQKASFVRMLDNTDPHESKEIDTAMNQARIDGVWLASSLLNGVFSLEDLGPRYTNLSYIADRRPEQAGKSESLYQKNTEAYAQMLGGVLHSFFEAGVGFAEGRSSLWHMDAHIKPELVREWLERCKKESWKTNILKNTWTMGPIKGIGYEWEKVQKIIAQKRGK